VKSGSPYVRLGLVRGPGRILIVLLAALLMAGAAGCGSDEESPSTTTSSTDTSSTTSSGEVPEDPAEIPDEPAKLPKGWSEEDNPTAGFTFGLPPGWSARPTEGGQGSVITSPDELIVMTITADRTTGALELPLDEFATRTAEALGSDVVGADRFEDLFVTDPAPFKVDEGYEAEAVRASGTSSKTGVEELVFVVVVRRPDVASYVVISRENAEQKSKVVSRDDVKLIVRSLRGRPAN